ncbi:MAG: hypothetical protein GY805_03090 [Chloroflexi bacterium]|nr:hypothetical protein [Chloroflexota bacterium]
MRTLTRILGWLYAQSLKLYPPDFRDAFGEEMTAVFTQTMMDAVERGRWGVAAVLLHELRDLPPNLAREHWHSFTKGESPMTSIHRKPEWFFYPAWIILQALAIPAAFILSFAILFVALKFIGDYVYVNGVRHITEDYLFDYIFFPANSLMTGLLQYWLLRRYLSRIGSWILVTAAGALLGAVLIFGWLNAAAYLGIAEGMPDSFALDPVFMILGFSVGMGQWLLLRRRLPQAGWWIAAHVIGWGLLRLVTGNTLEQFDLLALSVLPACVTAVALALLINQAGLLEPKDI